MLSLSQSKKIWPIWKVGSISRTNVKLDKLSRESKIRYYELLQERKRRILQAKPMYKPNEGQLQVHKDEKPIRVVAAGNGCWAPGTRMRMYDGSTKAVEDIEIGDLLMGPDSTPRKVQDLFRGTEPMYKVSPKQSDSFEVNESHMLSLRRWKKVPGNYNRSYAGYEEVSVKDFLIWGNERRRTSYQWRPEAGIEYPHQQVEIDPYLLGMWLGDGHSRGPGFTNMDQVLIDCWYAEAANRNLDVRVVTQNKSKCCSYFMSRKDRFSKNSLLEDLRGYELIKNKHIPQVYKISSIEQRLQLLAGLIDTDGHLSKGSLYEIIQKRERLANDIRELAQSLGFKASKRTKVINGVPYYRIHIIGDIQRIPVRLEHKRCIQKHQRAGHKESFRITPSGIGKFYGFMVDKDHLVCMADYTVQRNSGKSTLGVQEVVWWATGYNPINETFSKVPAKVVILLDQPSKVDEVWLPEFRKWYPLDDECELVKHGKPFVNEIIFKNGSQILFFFHEQADLAFEGIQFDYLVADEPLPRRVWIALTRGARRKGHKPRFLILGTPLGQAWMYRDLWRAAEEGERDDIGIHRFSTDVNKDNLAEGYIEQFSKNLTEQEKLVRLKGHFSHLDGLALAHLFDRKIHIVPAFPWPDGKPVVLVIDPHQAKPHTAVLVGATGDGRIYYIKEMKSKSPARAFAQELRAFYEGFRVVDYAIDSLGETPGTGGEGSLSFSDALRKYGVPVRSTSFSDKNDEDFIQRIKQVLEVPDEKDNFGRRIPKLAIMDGNRGIISDLECVQWTKYRNEALFKPKLDISNRDYLSCLKYALATTISAMSDVQRMPKARRAGRSPWSGG